MLATLSTDRTEASDPTEPIDRIEPADPIDRIDPAEPIDSVDPAEPPAASWLLFVMTRILALPEPSPAALPV